MIKEAVKSTEHHSLPTLSAVEETLLITLWARAAESRRSDAILRDENALRLARSLKSELTRFKHGWKSQIGVAVRDRYFDRIVGNFLANNPGAVVVNLGSGLDTRFHRLDDGQVTWFDLDLPAALALRRRHLPESPRNVYLAQDALDFSWMQRVKSTGVRPTLLIAEGVLMFLPREQVQNLLVTFAEIFPGGEMIFDLIGGLMVRCPFLHDTLPKTKARFAWGASSLNEADTWSDRYEVLESRSMLDESPSRWRWMRFCRHAPYLHRQFFALHLRSTIPRIDPAPGDGNGSQKRTSSTALSSSRVEVT